MTDTLTVYWSPAAYTLKESWSMLYDSPTHVLSKYRKTKTADIGTSHMFTCPATTNAFKNLYEIQMTINDSLRLPTNIHNYPSHTSLDQTSKISAAVTRKSAIEGYTDITMNLSWIFFAEESLVTRFTAPFFPPTSPAKDVLLTTGEFDIGLWFRPYRLNYLVPFNVNELFFVKDNPLFYIDFKTDKKIVFKKFIYTDSLFSIAEECSNSPRRYGFFKSLSERYADAKRVELQKRVLFEIKKNVIE